MLESERGRIRPPDLDDRQWSDIVEEARALIPKYAPQWTDHNASDLGIALIELFAFLVEGLIYRLNRIPEKNYVAFLNLLGIKRLPATPARVYLTFTAEQNPVLVPRGKQAQTQGREGEAPVIFETDADVLVLPTRLSSCLLIRGTSYSDEGPALVAPPNEGLLKTIPEGQAVQLCLGFNKATPEEIRLQFEIIKAPLANSVSWHYSKGNLLPDAWVPITNIVDGTKGLQHDGVVRLIMPADWADQAPNTWTGLTPASGTAPTIPSFWIGLRIANLTNPAAEILVGVRRVLFNSVSAHNALTASDEELGRSDGKPFQVFPLKNRPLFKTPDADPPYQHVVVKVGNDDWAQGDDFPAGEGKVYRLDPVAGEIVFGNYDPVSKKGRGSIPPEGTKVVAASYRYVAGGTSGTVGASAVSAMRTPVSNIIGVTNLGSSFGASDEEPIAETLRRAPAEIKTRDRAVTAGDYELLAQEASTDVRIVRCLAPYVDELTGKPWTYGAIDRSPGNVTVIIVPDQGQAVARPEPTKDQISEVLQFLDRRRDVTSRLVVTGPRYLPIQAKVDVVVWRKSLEQGLISNPDEIAKDILRRLREFLHPVLGGPERIGWQIGQHVIISDLYKAIMPDERYGFIEKVRLTPETPAYHYPPLGPGGNWDEKERPYKLLESLSWVRVTDYELVCYGNTSNVVPTVT